MLVVHDLARSAQELAALHPTTVASVKRAVGDTDTMVVRVPVGERFEHVPKARTLVLVLDGLGTVAVEDWRATLAAGHLVEVPPEARLHVTADGDAPVILYMTSTAGAAGVTDATSAAGPALDGEGEPDGEGVPEAAD